jgi:hypothetical protein
VDIDGELKYIDTPLSRCKFITYEKYLAQQARMVVGGDSVVLR